MASKAMDGSFSAKKISEKAHELRGSFKVSRQNAHAMLLNSQNKLKVYVNQFKI